MPVKDSERKDQPVHKRLVVRFSPGRDSERKDEKTGMNHSSLKYPCCVSPLDANRKR